MSHAAPPTIDLQLLTWVQTCAYIVPYDARVKYTEIARVPYSAAAAWQPVRPDDLSGIMLPADTARFRFYRILRAVTDDRDCLRTLRSDPFDFTGWSYINGRVLSRREVLIGLDRSGQDPRYLMDEMDRAFTDWAVWLSDSRRAFPYLAHDQVISSPLLSLTGQPHFGG